MAYQRDHPNDALPLLPPSASAWETVAVYKKLSEARAALAELKGRLPIIPNPLMLINTLVLQEAKDSSTIENIVTSNDRLFKAFSARSSTDAAAKEVLRYREALWKAFQGMGPSSTITEEMIVSIFTAITEKDEQLRDRQVYIGNSAMVAYTPPSPGEVLREKLGNWISTASSTTDIDPLILMAMLHYQFEAIHPFSDGNGRTGRILNVLFLCSRGLLDLPVLYLSKYVLKNRSDYYRLLLEVTEQERWQEWILFMLEGVRDTSVMTLARVNSIVDAYNQVRERVRTEAKDIYSRELVDVLFSQPYCKISILEDQKIASRNTASKYLKRLEEMQILEPENIGKEILYKNRPLFAILSQP